MNQGEITYQTPKQPRQLRLDSTTFCNASCLSCHRFLSNRQGEMSQGLITQILQDVSKWPEPLTEIIPVNYGEFFMRKDWAWILMQIAYYLPYTQIVLPTNGSFMDDKLVANLAKVPTLKIINFSVNAYFDGTYEQFMKLPAETIPKIRKAIAQLRILRSDITLWVSMVFDPMYQSDLERDMFKAYWEGWAYPQILPAASAGRPNKKPLNLVELPCRSIFSDLVIGYDKKISSCCFDSNFSLDLG